VTTVGVYDRLAQYYDVCYADKDYVAECDFIEAAFARFGQRPKTILDLACGTGNHGLGLAARGYEPCGVDRSAAMLARYRDKARTKGLSVELHEQDLRGLQLKRQFDAAICMFDAVGYLSADADLVAFFSRLRTHVRPGGLCLIEFWHAAAVLRGHDPVRVRESRTEHARLVRISTTTLDAARQIANIEFRILAWEGDRLVDSFAELHAVRYFPPEELCSMLAATGWTLRHLCPSFDLDGPVDATAWHLIAIATPVGSPATGAREPS